LYVNVIVITNVIILIVTKTAFKFVFIWSFDHGVCL
jgi:hypothetical protein